MLLFLIRIKASDSAKPTKYRIFSSCVFVQRVCGYIVAEITKEGGGGGGGKDNIERGLIRSCCVLQESTS